MVLTFSPHRDAGGTLHLPSPTGIHHVDASSAIRQLRRSLSRSPSKSSDFRLLPSRISPQTNSIPFISSPLSPSRRANQGSLLLLPTSLHTSPVAVPYPPNTRVNRPIVRRAGSLQIARSRTSPKSPSKRPLTISSDQGNTPPRPPSFTPPGEENWASSCAKPTDDSASSESTSDFCMTGMMGNSFAPKPITGRIEKRRSGNLGLLFPAVSPLKRSDGILNHDHAGLESPSTKRRSLHASFGSDFSIFDNNEGERAGAVPLEDAAQSGSVKSPSTSPFATVPKRSSSLRKSTLQQRQNDRSFLSRPRLDPDCFESPPKSPALFMRPRLSLDGDLSLPSGFETAISSHSPFSSSHAVFALNQTGAQHAPPAAHPLSRAITQSSTSSLADDSPTHEHTLRDDRPKGVFGFSKSLPPGAIRPGAARPLKREDSTSSSDSFATPENYRLVKPLPAAFMSTGLISKKNRNAEDSRNLFGLSKNMPDTPCKRPTTIFPTAQKALPLGPIRKPKLVRQSNTVVPSTPFNRQDAHPTPSPFTRGTGLFSSVFNKPAISRRSSFVSTDGDEQSLSQSPSARHESQASAESDLPPTPTKQSFYSTNGQVIFGSRMLPVTFHERLSDPKGSSRKFIFNSSIAVGTKVLWLLIYPIIPPFDMAFLSLSPLPVITANGLSALNDPSENTTPQTPKESIFPPDPSGLSISAPNESPLNKEKFNSSVFTLPATPTGPRDYFMPAGKRASFPLGSYSAPDVDLTLTSRFAKVELIGTGEFSQVYRVSNPQSALSYNSFFSLQTTSPSTFPEHVWAIKKAKQPYSGVKDRQRRIREVEILKALANSDHVISFVDSWEDKGYLYIQTEFCEEGSLDVFLAQEGLKARLDDFRIWKILLELSWVKILPPG